MRGKRDPWDKVPDPTVQELEESAARLDELTEKVQAETGEKNLREANVDKYEGLIHDMAKGESVQEQPAEVPVDAINPAHYRGFTDGAEVIQITEHLSFNRGNAVKYLARAGKKELARELEDLEKALWYVQREINRVRNAK